MTAVSGEGRTYFFPVPSFCFLWVLLYFADRISDHVTFIINVVVNDGFNKILSTEVRHISVLTLAFAFRNWEKRWKSQSELPVSFPRFEPVDTAAQIFSHIRTELNVFSAGLHWAL
jgi:hypothetical protein